jgi:hypothetical protein|tara:strand:+ start:6766 stop:6957 length:192 start_codon:yes stop_codon:yes gene_type:complete
MLNLEMTKKKLEQRVEELETKLAQANEVIQFVLNIVFMWRNKKIGNLRGINTISKIFVEKEKE